MRARWLALPVAALLLGSCTSASGSDGSPEVENKYLSEMRDAGIMDDSQSRDFAQTMCLVTTTDQAERVLTMVVDKHPEGVQAAGIAAGWGIRAYCPQNARLWAEATQLLTEARS